MSLRTLHSSMRDIPAHPTQRLCTSPPGKPICYVNYSLHSIISSAVATHSIVNNKYTQRPKLWPCWVLAGTIDQMIFTMLVFSYFKLFIFRHLWTSRWSFITALNIALISFVLFNLFKQKIYILAISLFCKDMSHDFVILPACVRYPGINPIWFHHKAQDRVLMSQFALIG